jgi:hypothetical protein
MTLGSAFADPFIERDTIYLVVFRDISHSFQQTLRCYINIDPRPLLSALFTLHLPKSSCHVRTAVALVKAEWLLYVSPALTH